MLPPWLNPSKDFPGLLSRNPVLYMAGNTKSGVAPATSPASFEPRFLFLCAFHFPKAAGTLQWLFPLSDMPSPSGSGSWRTLPKSPLQVLGLHSQTLGPGPGAAVEQGPVLRGSPVLGFDAVRLQEVLLIEQFEDKFTHGEVVAVWCGHGCFCSWS